MSEVYEHQIHVNIGGMARRPVVTLWCSDCLVTVGDFDQINDWTALQEVATLHQSRPSRRETLQQLAKETTA